MARGVSRGGRTDAKLTNIPVPEASLAGIAVGFALEQVRPWRLRKRRTGWVALTAGSLVIASSVQAATTELAKPEALVTGGPYAVSRNPMYVGWILLQLGIGLITRSGWVVATVPLVGAAMHREVLGEERALATKFGDEYRAYRERVRRYL